MYSNKIIDKRLIQLLYIARPIVDALAIHFDLSSHHSVIPFE